MLRSQLRDGAIAAAKGYSHETAGVPHVLFAAVKQFRERPEIAALLSRAKEGLGPRGTASSVPRIDDDAAALLATFTSTEVVLQEILSRFGSGGHADAIGGTVAVASDATSDHAGKAVPARNNAASTEDVSAILAELDALVGLETVKRQLRRVAAVVQGNQERLKAGITPIGTSLHLVFTGAPGTGKTTVARLVARLYAATGALPGANFTEATRADLVAGYVGQTAIKTSEVIARTRPGVLFIDEAYALAPSHHGDFGAEAVATLVKAMEDHRNDFAVIAAGYGEETMALIKSNPGLKSRFKTYIEFTDYSPPELTEIFARLATANSVNLGAGVHEKAQRIFVDASHQTDFGNARFARYLFEEAFAQMCARAAADGKVELHELSELTADDLQWDSKATAQHMRQIGFGGAT